MLQISKSIMRGQDFGFYNATDENHELHIMVENGKIVSITNCRTNRVLTNKKIVKMVDDAMAAYFESQRQPETSEAPIDPEAKYIVVQDHAEDGTRYLRSTPHPYGSTDQWVEEPERATLLTKRVALRAVEMYCPKLHSGYVARAWVVVSVDDQDGGGVVVNDGTITYEMFKRPTPLPRNIAEDVLTSCGGNFKMREL